VLIAASCGFLVLSFWLGGLAGSFNPHSHTPACIFMDAPRPSLTEGRTQLRSGPHKIRFVRSPVAGTMKLVKPEDGQ
jgi:hypothetical protein